MANKYGTSVYYGTDRLYGEPTTSYTAESATSATYSMDGGFGDGEFGLGVFGVGADIEVVTFTTESAAATTYTRE